MSQEILDPEHIHRMQAERVHHQERWEQEASERTKFNQSVMPLNWQAYDADKVSAEDVMRDEAKQDDAEFNRRKKAA